MRRHVLLASATLVLAAALVAPIAADDDPTDTPSTDTPSNTVTEAIGVEVINVDVMVTDKKGRPIVGLDRDDFELRVDGRPVAISNFYEVRDPGGRDAGEGGQRRDVRPRLAVETEGALAPAVARTAVEPPHLVVLVDENHLGPAGRRRMLDHLPAFIEEQAASGTRVMTVIHGSSPRVIASFDADATTHVAALREHSQTTLAGIERQRSWRGFLDRVRTIYDSCNQGANQFDEMSPCDLCASELVAAARDYAQTAFHHRRSTLYGLETMVGVLRGVPGRKILFYVGDGFARQPGAEAIVHLQDLCSENIALFQHAIDDHPGADQLHSLAANANANRVTIYSLETTGLETFSAASVDNAGFSSGGRLTESSSKEVDLLSGALPSQSDRPGGRLSGSSPSTIHAPLATTDHVRSGNRQDALFFMADETGGRAILNLNDATPELAKLSEELHHYYSLGFTLESATDDRVRRIGVRVPRRDTVKVHHRRSFRYKPREELVAERTLSAQLIGVESNELDARVVIGVPTAVDDGLYRVPVDVFIPLDRLALEPGEELDQGRVAVMLAAPDREAARTHIRKQEVGVALPGGAEGYCRLGLEVELPAGDHLLGLGLWDQKGDQRSFLRLPVAVDPAKTLPAVVAEAE